MRITVFTKSYFDSKVECSSLVECKKLIHDNPSTNVRVQIDNFRMLLCPSYNGRTRNIDGFSDLALLYRYFNNVTEDKLSCITVGSKGIPGEIYVSNVE